MRVVGGKFRTMFKRSNRTEQNELLDSVGRAVVRRYASNEDNAFAVSDQPFLYSKVRIRIEEELQRRSAGENWLQLIGVAWRAVPAMFAVVAFAFVMFWSSDSVTTSLSSLTNFSDEALLVERDAGVERVVFAERPSPLSNDEVLATILDEDVRGEATR